jgi:chromosome partitioning protein
MGFLSRKTTTAEPSTNGEPPAVADELERVEQEATEESPAIRSEQEQADSRDLEKELAEAEEAGGGPEGDPAAPGGEAEEAAGNDVRTHPKTSNADSSDSDESESEPERLMPRDLIAPDRRKMAAEAAAAEEAAAETPVKHAEVIAFANQKGGVAKTTTTLNLAVAFAESGHRVLCIDLDPQGNLTMSQGIDPDKVEKSLYDVLVHDMPISEIIVKREIDIAVASIDLAGAEIAMSTKIGRERSLEKALKEVSADYDFVCIDTPPSLGLLTINALTAATRVIVPVQCEYLSMRGLVQLQNTLKMIQENLNPDVRIEGILPTMLDSRTVHAKEAVEILEENFGDLVFKSRIKKAIKFAEAPVRGASVLKYDSQSNAANYYRELAKEVLNGSS